MTIKSNLFLYSTFLLSTVVAAQHGAHVHGEAHLTLAMMENELHIEIESPAANLVGFEHAPQNPEEKQALDTVAQQLAGADQFLRFDGAECRLQKVDVAAPYSDSDHTELVSHGEHAGGAGDEQSEHTSFRVSYRFCCVNLARLESVYISLFASFPDIHEIKAQWLVPGQQGAATLTAQDNELQLK